MTRDDQARLDYYLLQRVQASGRQRFVIRIADHWPEYTGHVLAYFADCIDRATDTALVWDLTAGTQFEAPTCTGSSNRHRFTRPASLRERQDAADELKLRLGEAVEIVKNFRGKNETSI